MLMTVSLLIYAQEKTFIIKYLKSHATTEKRGGELSF